MLARGHMRGPVRPRPDCSSLDLALMAVLGAAPPATPGESGPCVWPSRLHSPWDCFWVLTGSRPPVFSVPLSGFSSSWRGCAQAGCSDPPGGSFPPSPRQAVRLQQA